MKSNFKIATTLVIMSEDGRIVAVLNVPAGLCDINDKLELMVKEHECGKSAKIESNDVIGSLEVGEFSAEILTEEDDIDIRIYTIESTAFYNAV